MITNWSIKYCDYDGTVAPSWHNNDYLGVFLTIDGFNITGKTVYVYYYTQTRDKNYNRQDSPPRLLTKKVAPFTTQLISYIRYYPNDAKFFFYFSNKELDVNTIQTDIPQKYWYEFRKTNNVDGIIPKRCVYEPGDMIFVGNRTECSSSSDSCHHTTAVWSYNNGVWGGSSNYHNHSGSASTRINVPNVKQSNQIYWTCDSAKNHPDSTSSMTRLYTIYDTDLPESDKWNPFDSFDMVKVKVNGAWVDCSDLYVKVNGSWVEPKEIYYKQNGTWVSL